MSSEIKPVKAWAVVTPQPFNCIRTDSVSMYGEESAIRVFMRGCVNSWEELQAQGWRVIPVMIVPVEKKGRSDAIQS